MDFSGLQQFFFSPLRNVSHSPAPSSGIQVQLACTLGPQTPCHGCQGRPSGRLSPGLLTPCSVPPCPPTCGPPPSARAEAVSVARSLGPEEWRLWRPPGVRTQSPECSQATRFQQRLLPVLLAGGPQGGAAPRLCSPGPWAVLRPSTDTAPMPLGGNVVFPPGSLPHQAGAEPPL